MDLAATFFVSIYGLAAISGAVLAWAEQTPSVTMLTAPAAICALLLNERYRIVRLSTMWSGIAGLIAFVFPLFEIFLGNEESPLLGVAHLITILQCVLLFHGKQAPQYWWIFATSCLQIALAAVLTSSPIFGLMILAYMFWALWSLSVFTLLLARLKYGRKEELFAEDAKWVWPELPDQNNQFVQTAESDQSESLHSSYRSSIQCDPHETDISWRFIFGVGTLSSAALVLGLIFFLLTPRLWIGTASSFQDVALEGLGRSMTGFSEKVQLTDFGRILESSAPVLELTLYDETGSRDAKGAKPINLRTFLSKLQQEEPLLRGTVLGTYQNGEWLSLKSTPSFFNTNPPLGSRSRSYIRQTIRLESIGSRTLFSLADPHYGYVEDSLGIIKVVHATHSLQYTPSTGPFRGAIRYHVMIPDRQVKSGFPRYSLRDEQSRNAAAPNNQGPRRFGGVGQPDAAIAPYLACDTNLSLVRQTAISIVNNLRRGSGGQEPSPASIARELVAHLRDSGQYTYSLDQSVFDPGLDPIEDFLLNRRAGHCQYFATALALLLRSSGIPSRVITGFKGGVETPEEGRLIVQQRHAHAWVEALLDGEWVTLDATPASREDSVDSIGSRSGWLNSIYTFFSGLWSDYVVNLSFNKQQRDLYAPFQAVGNAVGSQLLGKRNIVQGLKHGILHYWNHPEEWFSVQGGITAMVLMLSLVGLFYLLRGLYRFTRRVILGTGRNSQGGLRIDFYEQFLKAIKPLGLVPLPQQTQLEFAEQVEADWLSRNHPAEFLPLVREICSAFYRLRFGDQPLSAEQDARIRSGLQRLELHLRQARSFV